MGAATYVAAIGLGAVGMVLGYSAARILRLSVTVQRTISLETGIQNAPLAMAIVLVSFVGAEQQTALIIPALYGIFVVCLSTFAVLLFRRSDRAAQLSDQPT